MPVFQYKAANAAGEVINGTLTGASREQIVTQIQALGQIPIRVDQSASPSDTGSRRLFVSRRITVDQITAFTQQLGILLRAGMPLDRALSVLVSLNEHPRFASILDDVRTRVKSGATLTDAMEAQGVFSRFYLNLLRAGEAGGALEVVLERLAEHLERARQTRDMLVSAMIYPAILVFVSLLSVFLLLGYVVPQFTTLFEGFGQTLPVPTRITIAIGEGLQRYGWLGALLLLICVALLRWQLSKPAGRYRWHDRLLRLPVAGPIITKLEVARFSRTLSTLLHNGVPLLKALDIVKDTVGNQVIADGLERVAAGLKQGQSLAAPLGELARFPAFAVQMIQVGEQSGDLERILLQVAEVYERDTQNTIKGALALLEPLLILVLGAIIAAVIISILVAILGVNQLVF
jgi:general secretion pathway protein F